MRRFHQHRFDPGIKELAADQAKQRPSVHDTPLIWLTHQVSLQEAGSDAFGSLQVIRGRTRMLCSSTGCRGPASARSIRIRPLTRILMNKPGWVIFRQSNLVSAQEDGTTMMSMGCLATSCVMKARRGLAYGACWRACRWQDHKISYTASGTKPAPKFSDRSR